MCQAKKGELLTQKNQVLARWKEHFEEHLNEGSKSEQPSRPVDLRDGEVDTDLPSRGNRRGAEIPEKREDSWGTVSNDGPNLVDALHDVIQQARTNETLLGSWTEGV
jgi:hypothetical protein